MSEIYKIELEKKKKIGLTKLLTKKWAFRTFELSGQVLRFYKGKNLDGSFNVKGSFTRKLTSNEAEGKDFAIEVSIADPIFVKKVSQTLVVNAPNASIQEDFVKIMNLASSSANWDASSLYKRADDISVMLDASQRILSTETKGTNIVPILESNVPIANVKKHLSEMKDVADAVSKMLATEELYEYLLSLEHDYLESVKDSHFSYLYPASVIEDRLKSSIFALRVHQLHPIMYSTDKTKPYSATVNCKSIDSTLSKCPYPTCSNCLTTSEKYDVHVAKKTVTCRRCENKITYEAYTIRKFTLENVDFSVPTNPTIKAVMPALSSTTCDWKSYMAQVKVAVSAIASQLTKAEVKILRDSIASKVKTSGVLGSFSLDLVLGMYRQLDFVNKICCNYSYWLNDTVIAASIIRYNKFMTMMAHKRKDRSAIFVPTVDIDLVWHTHQTDTVSYEKFCRGSFGYVVDHDDTIVHSKLTASYSETFILWSELFGEPYSSHPPSYEEWRRGKGTINPIRSYFLNKHWKKHCGVWNDNVYYYGTVEPTAIPVDGDEVVTIPAEDVQVVRDSEGSDRIDRRKSVKREVRPIAVIGTPVMDNRTKPIDSDIGLLVGGSLLYIYAYDNYSSGGCGSYFGDNGNGNGFDGGGCCNNAGDGGGCCSSGDGGGCASGGGDL